MAVEVDVQNIGSGYNRSIINNNFTAIQEALEDALSRSGDSPNMMQSDLDMNSNDLLNVGTINTTAIIVDGEEFVPSSVTAKGDPGETPAFTVLSTITGDAGTNADVELGGTDLEPTLQFTIPRGNTGASGAGSGDMVAAQNLSDVADASTAFNNIKQDATETSSGVVELATVAETTTGTDTTRATTPAGVAASVDAGSGMVLLESGNISGANLELSLSSHTDYHSFKLSLESVSATTSTQLCLRLGNGGVDSGTSDYHYSRINGNSGSDTFDTDSIVTSYIGLTSTNGLGTVDGEIDISNPLATKYCPVRSNLNGRFAVFNTMVFSQVWGMRIASKAINTMRLYPFSGTFSTGTYRLYGFK